MTITERLQQTVGLLTVRQVAELLGCHLQTVYGWVNEKKIPYLRIGSRVKFDAAALADWLAQRQVG